MDDDQRDRALTCTSSSEIDNLEQQIAGEKDKVRQGPVMYKWETGKSMETSRDVHCNVPSTSPPRCFIVRYALTLSDLESGIERMRNQRNCINIRQHPVETSIHWQACHYRMKRGLEFIMRKTERLFHTCGAKIMTGDGMPLTQCLFVPIHVHPEG